MNIEIKLGRNHSSAGIRGFYDDDVHSDQFFFLFFIHSISENVTVNCQVSNILIAIQKSLFTDTDVEFAATDLALRQRLYCYQWFK